VSFVSGLSSFLNGPPMNFRVTNIYYRREKCLSRIKHDYLTSLSCTKYDREMAKVCSIDGCENKVTAKGFCSKHYQQHRRENPDSVGSVGRPRQYPKELSAKYQGAPTMSVRLDPDLLEWVKAQGGSTWMRFVAGELRELAEDPEFEKWKERLRLNRDDS
jgi:hypothetical protein